MSRKYPRFSGCLTAAQSGIWKNPGKNPRNFPGISPGNFRTIPGKNSSGFLSNFPEIPPDFRGVTLRRKAGSVKTPKKSPGIFPGFPRKFSGVSSHFSRDGFRTKFPGNFPEKVPGIFSGSFLTKFSRKFPEKFPDNFFGKFF